MKILNCAMLVLASLLCISAEAKDKSKNSPVLTITQVSPSGAISVTVSNTSQDPIRIWQDWNSWGAACWRILLLRRGILEAFYQDPDQIFTRNFPSFDEIAGNMAIEKKFDVNGINWCRLGHCVAYGEHGYDGKPISFEPNDIIIVSYEVPRSSESTNQQAWYGFVSAMTKVSATRQMHTK